MLDVEIFRLHRNQIKEASKVLAASFFDYPMFTFYFPDIIRRERYLPWYFQNVLNTANSFGEVFVAEGVSGVVFFLKPEHPKITIWEYIQNGFLMTPLILGLRNFARSIECEQFVDDMREQLMGGRPHIYLWGLAVDPGKTKKGIGSTLIRFVLEKADREGVPAYLETHDEKNVPYYQNHGFDLVQSAIIPKHNLQFWCLLREPHKVKGESDFS